MAKDRARAASGGRLPPKQKRFVEEYLVDLNAGQAAIRAGYSRRSDRQHADVILSRPQIAAAFAEAQQRHRRPAKIVLIILSRQLCWHRRPTLLGT